MKLEHCCNYLFQKYNIFLIKNTEIRTIAIFLIMHRLTNGQNVRMAIKSIKMSFQLLKNSLRKLDSSYIYIIATVSEGMEKI